MSEIWRPVVGFEGWYEVSDHGRVRSVDRIFRRRPSRLHPDGCVMRYRGKLLTSCPTSSGHHVVMIRKGNLMLVHRLVLEAFRGPCPEQHEGLHRDDDTGNNHLGNLRWGTRSDNLKDAYRNGRRKRKAAA